MTNKTLGQMYLNELEAEAPASRKCLERMQENLFGWKPHEKSMPMGYLALLVAEIPRWIVSMIEEGTIDFATFKHIEAKNATDLLKQFDENMIKVREVLGKVSDEELAQKFELRSGEKVFMSMPKSEIIGPTINHLVHHRGQFSVYMRLNNIPVPAIYGPSADDGGGFQ